MPAVARCPRTLIDRRASCSSFIRVSEEVRHAVANGEPVVALESAAYTHGERSLLRDAVMQPCRPPIVMVKIYVLQR